MIPFPGESLPLDYALDAADDPVLYDEVTLRGPRVTGAAPSRTISAGQSWRVWVDPGYSNEYLEEDVPLDVAWVVETLSGSGTLTAADGYDADYVYDRTVPTPHALGSRTIDGAQTVIFPTTFSAADIYAGVRAITLDLQCAAGSVEVQQVKLRVWPAGGVLGGWVDQPAFSTPPNIVSLEGAQVVRGASSATGAPSDAWDAASATCAGGGSDGGPGPHPIDHGDSVGTAMVAGVLRSLAYPQAAPNIEVSTSIDGSTAVVGFQPNGVVLVVHGRDVAADDPIAPDLVEGVDYIAPPTEVPFDRNAWVQSTGTRTVSWLNAGVTFEVHPATTTLGGDVVSAGPSLSAYLTTTDPADTTTDTLDIDMVDGPAVVSSSDVEEFGTVGLPTGDGLIVVAISHSIASQVLPWPNLPVFAGNLVYEFRWAAHFGTGDPNASTFQAMKTVGNLPPYQVWNPTVQDARYVRLLGRGDGLGAGSNRLIGPGTPQSSVRLLGSL